jgi:hypothetical protein
LQKQLFLLLPFLSPTNKQKPNFPFFFSSPPPSSSGVLMGVTAGYWLFVHTSMDEYKLTTVQFNKLYKKDIAQKICYQGYFPFDFVNHGPLLLMFTKYIVYDVGSSAFDLSYCYLPVAWGWTWFIVIYIPYRISGGDPLYEALQPHKSMQEKIFVIIKMNVVTVCGYLAGFVMCKILFSGLFNFLAIVDPMPIVTSGSNFASTVGIQTAAMHSGL